LCLSQEGPNSSTENAEVAVEREEVKGKSGRRIRWHEGDKFLDECDDNHLWNRSKATLVEAVGGVRCHSGSKIIILKCGR